MPLPPETFATLRLHGRMPCREDAAAVFAAYAADPAVTLYLTWKPYTEVAPLAEYLARQSARWTGPERMCNYLLSP